MEIINSLIISIVEAPFWTFVIVCIIGGSFIAFTLWYGFYVLALPLMALFSTVKIMIKNRRSHIIHSPQLGFTMADGGEKIEEGNCSNPCHINNKKTIVREEVL